MEIPKIGNPLTDEQVEFLQIFTKSCRHSILQMVTNAQSGHPGGSLSSIDYLATLYAYIVSQTGEKTVISHGHISPAAYSVLAELAYIDKQDVIENFRKINHPYEGHVTRHVPGILYGTGPLGIGVSVGAGFALAEKLHNQEKKAFCLMGDGEVQEGQVHEMINFATHHKLNNFILFVDYNEVQLSGSLEETLDIDVPKIFEAGGFEVINTNAHDFQEIWSALGQAYGVIDRPVVIIGHTIMGKGVDFMEKDGAEHKSDWHGKPPKPEQSEESIKALELDDKENELLNKFRSENIKWHPEKPSFPKLLSKVEIKTGTPIVYEPDDNTPCRGAYGKALLDLAKNNQNVVALTADVGMSVMTKYVQDELPSQHIECGIAEQHMVTTAGALSLSDFVPFASTYGAFMTSRPKDQARVNDLNNCNVKMVSSHCGLSVGEDGPTHQAIDDAGSFLGFFNTMLIEPADANHADRLIRYIASHFGNFYMRMGRHNIPQITKEDGTIFYDENYNYEYGKCDCLREGNDMTVVAIGSMVSHALKAYNSLKETHPNLSIDLIAATSIKAFDDTLKNSIIKTKKILTVEDHNTFSGLGSQIARLVTKEGIKLEKFEMLGVEEYQLSGKSDQLYEKAGLDAQSISNTILKLSQ